MMTDRNVINQAQVDAQPSNPLSVEQRRIAAAFMHAKRNAHQSAPSFIAEEIATRMDEKLAWITVPVKSIHPEYLPCDARSLQLLHGRFGELGAVTGLPPAQASAKKSWFRRITGTDNSTSDLSFKYIDAEKFIKGVYENNADLLWSNLLAVSLPEPLTLPARWAEAINQGGYVMFSSLGPDTAQELVPILCELGAKPELRNLADMHDWGDALVHAGFADPVMDMEKITLTYRDPMTALRELSCIMATRPLRPGLKSRQQLVKCLQALQAQRNEAGLIPITLEVIYGHAFKVARSTSSSATSLQELKATLPSQRR